MFWLLLARARLRLPQTQAPPILALAGPPSLSTQKAGAHRHHAEGHRIREITAAKMVEALQISAQLTHVQEVDMTAIWDLRKQSKQAFIEKYEANLSFLPFIVKATVEALVSPPERQCFLPHVSRAHTPRAQQGTGPHPCRRLPRQSLGWLTRHATTS